MTHSTDASIVNENFEPDVQRLRDLRPLLEPLAAAETALAEEATKAQPSTSLEDGRQAVAGKVGNIGADSIVAVETDVTAAAPVIATQVQTSIETARVRFKDYAKAVAAADRAGTAALYAAMDLGDAIKALKKIAPARRQEAWIRDYIPGISKTVINECAQLAEARERIERELTGSAGQMSIRAALRLIRGKKTKAAAQADAATDIDAFEQEASAEKFEQKVDLPLTFPKEIAPILVAVSDLLLMVRMGESDEQIVAAARDADAALFAIDPNRTLFNLALPVTEEAHAAT